jgi:hypothetical protein
MVEAEFSQNALILLNGGFFCIWVSVQRSSYFILTAAFIFRFHHFLSFYFLTSVYDYSYSFLLFHDFNCLLSPYTFEADARLNVI